MAYDLEGLAELRTERALRQIEPTGYHEDELRREIMRAVRYSQTTTNASIVPLMAESASAIAIEAALVSLREGAANPLQAAERAVRDLVDRIADWHDARWKVVVRAGTGVDIANLINREAIRPQLEAALRRNVALIRNVAEDTLVRVERATWDAYENARSMADYRRDLRDQFGFSRNRAKLIARDQMGKMTASLDQARHAEAKIKSYIWNTSRDNRVRAAHAAREGREFRWSAPPSDGHPGEPINCRCRSKAVLKPKGGAVAGGGGGVTTSRPIKGTDAETLRAEMDTAYRGGSPLGRRAMDRMDPIGHIDELNYQTGAYDTINHAMFMNPAIRGGGKYDEILRHEMAHAFDFNVGAKLGVRSLSEADNVMTGAFRDYTAMRTAAAAKSADRLEASLAANPRMLNSNGTPNFTAIADELGLTREQRLDIREAVRTDLERVRMAIAMKTQDPTYVVEMVGMAIKRGNIGRNELGQLENFADFIEAITKAEFGAGHGAAYYKGFDLLGTGGYTMGHSAEAFANWFSLTQGPGGRVWNTILREMAPEYHSRMTERVVYALDRLDELN